MQVSLNLTSKNNVQNFKSTKANSTTVQSATTLNNSIKLNSNAIRNHYFSNINFKGNHNELELKMSELGRILIDACDFYSSLENPQPLTAQDLEAKFTNFMQETFGSLDAQLFEKYETQIAPALDKMRSELPKAKREARSILAKTVGIIEGGITQRVKTEIKEDSAHEFFRYEEKTLTQYNEEDKPIFKISYRKRINEDAIKNIEIIQYNKDGTHNFLRANGSNIRYYKQGEGHPEKIDSNSKIKYSEIWLFKLDDKGLNFQYHDPNGQDYGNNDEKGIVFQVGNASKYCAVLKDMRCDIYDDKLVFKSEATGNNGKRILPLPKIETETKDS